MRGCVPDMRRLAALLAALLLVISADAQAATMKKGLYSAYVSEDAPKLRQLGVTLNTRGLPWVDVASRRPVSPTEPADPAYKWPAELDAAISTNDGLGIDTSLQVIYAPRWANGDRSGSFRPSSARDYANFIAAAAKRYPSVRLWQIWGEVNGGPYVWQPQPKGIRFRTTLTREQRREPEFYARMLDASYVALKSVNRKNKVIGGMTVAGAYYSPATPPATWTKYMRLPNGKRPRMDLFGHNPMLLARRPDLTQGPRFAGWRDMSDLDTTIREIDRYFPGRKLPIFVSEFAVWDKPGSLHWHVNRATQARWTRLALGIARRSKRVHTFSWASLRNTPALPGWGLLDARGERKPAFRAFANG